MIIKKFLLADMTNNKVLARNNFDKQFFNKKIKIINLFSNHLVISK